MIWVTWRQHRTEAMVMILVLLLALLVLYQSGRSMISILEEGGPSELAGFVEGMDVPFLLLPLVLGMFVGAPLISRDLELGTYRLAWTQGVTRQSWLRSKILLAFVVSLACFTLLTLVLIWWNQPVNGALGPFHTFDINGLVMIPYAAFALALGICLGVAFGKAVPSMALTLLLFLGVRLLVAFLRPSYQLPLEVAWDFAGLNPADRGWILESSVTDQLGNPVDRRQMVESCAQGEVVNESGEVLTSSGVPLFECFHDNGWMQHFIYQPFERFWLFQAIESAIFLALAAGLMAIAFWWVRRKLS